MTMKNFINDLQIGPSWTHHNLTVHPLLNTISEAPCYLTLDEALDSKRFRIGEISLNGSVPELKVLNGLSQPVLLLDGEELVVPGLDARLVAHRILER